MPPRDLDRLTRVYGPTTWDVYERLDVSLNPNGPDWLYELAGQYLQSGDVALDAGCRDAEHLIRLVEANQATGVGVDPVEIHVERARLAVDAAGLADRVMLHQGVMHDLPYDDGYFDFVWCRDVLEQVDDLDGALGELVRLMKPSARLLVYTTFATELLDGRDAEMMRRHIGNVLGNLDAGFIEARSGVQTSRSNARTPSAPSGGSTPRSARSLPRGRCCASRAYVASVTTSSMGTARKSTTTSKPISTGRSSSSSASSCPSSTSLHRGSRR